MSFLKNQKSKYGNYTPTNPQKYTGGYPIRVMSTWETIYMRYLDNNPAVIAWSSESIAIPYKHPILKDHNGLPRTARYYPDFFVVVKTRTGEIEKIICEIKPFKETIQPSTRGNKSNKTKLYESKTWAINSAKWIAAERYCQKMGYRFIKITEKQLIR